MNGHVSTQAEMFQQIVNDFYAFQEEQLKYYKLTQDFMSSPHIRLRPRIYSDGSHWLAVLGDDLTNGVVGVGATPMAAAKDFDHNFETQKADHFNN